MEVPQGIEGYFTVLEGVETCCPHLVCFWVLFIFLLLSTLPLFLFLFLYVTGEGLSDLRNQVL